MEMFIPVFAGKYLVFLSIYYKLKGGTRVSTLLNVQNTDRGCLLSMKRFYWLSILLYWH